MKKSLIYSIALILTACFGVAHAATVTVTTETATGPGSLTAAINALNDGDTIAFNIPGAGVHYIQTPPDGFPLITKNNITIDGYTQPGSSVNTASIHAANNAVLKIVLTSTNGNALAMQTACETSWGSAIPRLGYGDDEQAVLGFFHATNALIRGLVIQASHNTTATQSAGTCKAICFAANSAENGGGMCQNWRVSGCWFGLDPVTKQVAFCDDSVFGAGAVATPRIAIASYRTRNAVAPDNTVYNVPGTIGVAAGSANPRADFNVFVTGYGFDSEGLDYRISGNFYGLLPDGVTVADMSMLNGGAQQGDGFIEIGRYTSNLTIGTDGDGVNDADEGNVFGGSANDLGPGTMINLYSDPRTNIVIAGNWFNLGVDGVTHFTNSAPMVDGLGGVSTVRIGSDFDGLSDALEANRIYNITNAQNAFINGTGGSINIGARVSMRGNETVNNELIPYSYANGLGTRLGNFTNYCLPYMDPATNSVIPTLDPASIYPHLKGTFAIGTNGYTTIIIDVYQLDLAGWNNGKVVATAVSPWPELTDGFSFTNGFAQGSKYLGSRVVPNTGIFDIDITGMPPGEMGQFTVTANYSADPAGTHNGRVHTSDFSMPVYVLPGNAASVGATQIVPDVACWYNATGNYVTNGFIDLANQATPATLGNWEPYISSLGDSAFLIEFNTYANDGLLANQNNVVAKQPAAGGPAKLDYCFYADNGTPFKGALNLSRQNGNPGRVAGDKRYGANKFITEAETSLGQIAEFQTVARWGNNDMYTGNNRYATEQIFTMDLFTLAQTPVTNAWDYTLGPFVGAVVNTGNAPQLVRTGGRSEFLDNGNIVVMIDDKTGMIDPGNEVTTFSIIQPNGTLVKSATLAKNQDIWDNMAAVKGGFVIRVHNSLLFYDNSGTLTFSNDVNVSSGMNFAGGADVGGRGDGLRIGGDIRSYYVYLAGTVNGGGGAAEAGVAAWDTRTGQYVGGSIVTDGDPAVTQCDRTSVAVDALNRVCVAYAYKPDKVLFGYQVAARVAQFDGAKFTWLTHSFFPFLNHDQDPAAVLGYTTVGPTVAMNTRQICIAAKGTINNANNVGAGPNSLNEQTVYTVLSHPVPVAAPVPVISMTQSGNNLNISWNPEDGLFTVQTKSSLTAGSWVNATAGNVLPPVSVPIGAGSQFIRLAR